ncbi:MAG: hypothetical protein R3B71_03455 [Candidatus Gracilibacteria bacterium]|nr:hypothetical protein [Candidatus Peregrinibacteria bacterium]
MSYLDKIESQPDVKPAPADTDKLVSQYYETAEAAQQLVAGFIHEMFQVIDRKEMQEFNAINSILWELLDGHQKMRQRRTKAGYNQKFSIETLEDMIEELKSNFFEYICDIRGPETPPSGQYEFGNQHTQVDEVSQQMSSSIIDTLTGQALDLDQEEPTEDDLAAMEKLLQEEFAELFEE